MEGKNTQENIGIVISDDIEALKTLYSSKMDILKFNMERSFITTIQTITLNIVVLGAYVASKLQLTIEAKSLGSFVLIFFNTFSILYLRNKGKTHKDRRDEIAFVEDALINKCPSLIGKISGSPSKLNTFLKGSGLFIFGVSLTCICSVAAFWVPLLIVEKTQNKNTVREHIVEVKKMPGNKIQKSETTETDRITIRNNDE